MVRAKVREGSLGGRSENTEGVGFISSLTGNQYSDPSVSPLYVIRFISQRSKNKGERQVIAVCHRPVFKRKVSRFVWFDFLFPCRNLWTS